MKSQNPELQIMHKLISTLGILIEKVQIEKDNNIDSNDAVLHDIEYLFQLKYFRKDEFFKKSAEFLSANLFATQALDSNRKSQSFERVIEYSRPKECLVVEYENHPSWCTDENWHGLKCKMLLEIFKETNSKINSVRVQSIKSINEISKSNPDLLLNSNILQILQGRLNDNSISVRDSSLELAGTLINLQPKLIDMYYSTIVGRLDVIGF